MVGVRLLRNHASHVPGVRFLHFAYPIFKTILEPDLYIVFKIGLNWKLQDAIGTRSTFHFAYLNTPVIMKPKRRAILVRLPESLVDRLDAVTYDLRMRSRSDYIRRSLERALEFSEAHEVPCSKIPIFSGRWPGSETVRSAPLVQTDPDPSTHFDTIPSI
ncbi:MAG TPA: ribbon-helix-helix domain-containing protein [Bryobacteraceae bacterium]|nr:ribbon-helix-helix domain-containing protein [Bryobacteraceae bacterium]